MAAVNEHDRDSVLSVYMLGCVDFESALALQRRLHYEVSGNRTQAALILCEHPPLITVGRSGSRAHILCEPEELRSRQWRIRWLNRGGGCLLHLPGQLAVYPILPLDHLELGLEDYIAKLEQVAVRVLDDFGITAAGKQGDAGVWVGERQAASRPVAALGIAVRDWVSSHGMWFNVHVPLDLFRLVRWGGRQQEPMTSVEKERRGPLRPGLFRQRLVEHFETLFPFSRVAYFSAHPSLQRTTRKRVLVS